MPSSWRQQECKEGVPMPRISSATDADPSLPSRRSFFIAVMGAGIVLGYARPGLAAFELPASAGGELEITPSGPFEPTIWYGIDRTGAVTVNLIPAEISQHGGTALARIVADELEADWDKVRIVHVDTDPKCGQMVTRGSWSFWQSFP